MPGHQRQLPCPSVVRVYHYTLTSGKSCCPESKEKTSGSSIFRTLTGTPAADLSWPVSGNKASLGIQQLSLGPVNHVSGAVLGTLN